MKGLYGFLHGSAIKYPDKIFLQNGNRKWTYRELECISRNISAFLLAGGVQRGDRIIIFCDNSIQYIAAFFGIIGINAVAVPVNPIKMTESFLHIVKKCTPRLIVACDSTAVRLVDSLERHEVEWINIDSCFQNNDFYYAPLGDQDYEVDENAVAEILFTSGTTSEPKGIMLTHSNLLANTEAIVNYLKLTDNDSILMTLPFTYSYGNSVLLTHIFAGASIILENSSAYPYKILQEIEKCRVTGFSTVGSYISLLLKCIRSSNREGKEFGYLRYITLAGEATNNDDVCYIRGSFPSIRLYVMYGQTEASARLSYLEPELLNSKLGSIGKGLCNVELRVVDGNGCDIKPGELGEIIARGPSIMKGYWEDPAGTAETLKNGWLYTGDFATVDDEGFLYVKGRKTDIIKYMGHRISPVEIENVINSCAMVKESAVIESTLEGLPVIKAFLVLDKQCPLEEIKKLILPKLPIYMRPHIIEVIDQLPRTDSGKVKRSALRRIQCVE